MPNEWLRDAFLALLQGLTEFLPISSSAHLILPSAILGWPDQGLAFDVAVHLGTLLAVVLYFYRELLGLSAGCLRAVHSKTLNQETRMVGFLALATIPVVVAGLLLKNFVEESLRGTLVIAVSTLVFGIVLWHADRKKNAYRDARELNWKSALIIGLAQILALIPGTSRSGITMTAALYCGLDRVTASRFSFLLAIPVITAAASLLLFELLGMTQVPWGVLIYGVVIAAISAFICIHYFLKFIARVGFLPFAIYRLVLGLFLLYWSFS